MKRTIFISSGHSNKVGRDRGAISGTFVEGELTVALRKLIVAELTTLGNVPVIDVENSILSESIAFFKNKTSKNSIVLDIHFNSGPSTAKGVETFIPLSYTAFEVDLASKLSKTVADILETSLRGSVAGKMGVKTENQSQHPSLGWMRLTGENVLLEVCFISNPDEMKKYTSRIGQLAKAIARVLYDASLINEVSPIISTPVSGTGSVTYTVKSGDNLTKIATAYGTTVAKIINDNGLKSSVIQVGQKLIIKK